MINQLYFFVYTVYTQHIIIISCSIESFLNPLSEVLNYGKCFNEHNSATIWHKISSYIIPIALSFYRANGTFLKRVNFRKTGKLFDIDSIADDFRVKFVLLK